MRQKMFTGSILFLCLQCALQPILLGQQYDCSFKAPLLTIDFGTGRDVPNINQLRLPSYRRVYNKCPIDGHYSFVSHTSGCFEDDWLTFSEDHTLSDKDGNMMVVNANRTGGIFLTTNINNLKDNTTYQFEAWLINVCNLFDNCPPLPPNIVIDLITPTGKKVAVFQTGPLPQGNSVIWRRYADTFVTPPEITSLVLTMKDITQGGCGNDFALDDITVRECIKTTPVTKTRAKPVPKSTKRQAATVVKPVAKKIVKPQGVKKDSTHAIIKKTVRDTPEIAMKKIKEKAAAIPLPKVLLTRENLLIKRIEAPAGEIVIDLYDYDQIDGDTVSIYDNNELIVSRAGLSKKPISFKIKVDAAQPHHELIMVANNLGSIPPNTSLMIITANNKRSEVFISSSEQKNAKLVIDLKE
jgi:hypothetical protein